MLARLRARASVARARAAPAVGGFTALAACGGGEVTILREAALLVGHAGAPLAGDLATTFDVHRSEATLGGSTIGLVSKHVPAPSKMKSKGGQHGEP